MAVVVKPNNSTSLLRAKTDLIRVATKLAKHDCMRIVNAFFIDFVRDRKQVTLDKDVALHPNLAIFRSMTKAYGLCGSCSGYMQTASTAFAEKVRSGIHIWNLIDFVETFLKMAHEDGEEFGSSCAQVRQDRDPFYQDKRFWKLECPGHIR